MDEFVGSTCFCGKSTVTQTNTNRSIIYLFFVSACKVKQLV